MKFFDIKSFIIMAVMMSGGIYLRASSLAPERFIAVFYTGLGSSLLLAGILLVKIFYNIKQNKTYESEDFLCRQLLKLYLMSFI